MQKRLKRSGKNTQKNYTEKGLNHQDNQDGVIIRLEPDILECEVKWALESITPKLVEVMEFQLTISNPKGWCCESAALNMPANLENSAAARGLKKVSFHPIPKKGRAKECSDYHTTALILYTTKTMFKILQARL